VLVGTHGPDDLQADAVRGGVEKVAVMRPLGAEVDELALPVGECGGDGPLPAGEGGVGRLDPVVADADDPPLAELRRAVQVPAPTRRCSRNSSPRTVTSRRSAASGGRQVKRAATAWSEVSMRWPTVTVTPGAHPGGAHGGTTATLSLPVPYIAEKLTCPKVSRENCQNPDRFPSTVGRPA
jgi:hypothetical protein